MTLDLMLARGDYSTAVSLAPTTAPSTWSGGAATAFQTSLDGVIALLGGVSTLLDLAEIAVDDLPEPGMACTAVSLDG